MQARDEFLTRILMGPKQFLIPIFQRTYSWSESHCQQLLQDVMRAGTHPSVQSHFVGSVVLAPNETATNASIPQWQVIDGQQRLTTFTLLIMALIRQANELELTQVCATSLEALKDYFVSNNFGQGDAHYKLLLTKTDCETLKCLIDGRKMVHPFSERIMENYEFFCEQLSGVTSIEQAYSGLQKIKIVEVMLTSQDDPQAIFESLNSTGLDLSQADLIRNYVLMRHDHGEQTRLYQQFWYPMEQLFAKQPPTRFDRFMQDFLTLETGSNALVKSRDVYPLFKIWFHEKLETANAQVVLERLHQLAGYYAAFMFGMEPDRRLSHGFQQLRALSEVAGPLVVRLYEAYSATQGKNDEFVQAINLIESYVLRRSVCGMDTRSLGSIFASIAQRIEPKAPLESMKVTFARIAARFPSDEEFLTALCEGDLYGKKTCRFVLERLENDSKEQIDTSDFSIEHVMPQNKNLNAEWKKMLGQDWMQTQQMWLHRLGNLTLTGYNAEYKDSSFATKKTINHGFNMSPLRLNRDIAKEDMWTPEQMKKRGNKLARQALTVWCPLVVDELVINRYIKMELRRRSNQGTVSDVLQPQWMPIYGQLHDMILELDSDITCIVSKSNISFYQLDPLIQIVNRKHGLGIAIAIDIEELAPNLSTLVLDTNIRTYRNVDISGVQAVIKEVVDIERIRPIIQVALELAQQ